MKKLAGYLWALFLAMLTFGIWIFPLLLVVFVIYAIIYIKWPDFFKKYL